MPKSNEVTEVKQGAIALPAEFAAELAAEAKDAAAEERPAISKLSTAGGMLRYEGNVVPGNQMEVVILAAVYRNVWYSGRYDPNNIQNPNCFALAEDDDGMAPHANVKEPVHASCEGCPKVEWKSDPNTGKGKACKESRRLVLIPAGALVDVDSVKKAEMALLDLPVTSQKNYGQFVNIAASSTGLPPYAVVANISVVPDAKTQFKVNIQPIRVAGGKEIIMALKARKEDALRIGLTPYDETSSTNSAVSPEQKARQDRAASKIA